jgi:hypothetical protein
MNSFGAAEFGAPQTIARQIVLHPNPPPTSEEGTRRCRQPIFLHETYPVERRRCPSRSNIPLRLLRRGRRPTRFRARRVEDQICEFFRRGRIRRATNNRAPKLSSTLTLLPRGRREPEGVGNVVGTPSTFCRAELPLLRRVRDQLQLALLDRTAWARCSCCGARSCACASAASGLALVLAARFYRGTLMS